MSIRWTEEQLREHFTRGGARPLQAPDATPKPRKYRNEPVVVDGIRFDSKLEARYYEQLKLRRAAGEVAWFIRQPRFDLPGGVVYRADFLAVLAAGGVEVVDTKGQDTRESITKRKQVKHLYGVDVIVWRASR
jgi:hypothetical protein